LGHRARSWEEGAGSGVVVLSAEWNEHGAWRKESGAGIGFDDE